MQRRGSHTSCGHLHRRGHRFVLAFEVQQESSGSGSSVFAGVILVCASNPDGLHIEPTTVEGLLDETMVGDLGSVYSFTYGGEFTSATITMTFDSASLTDDAEPTIYYYNEETQLLEELVTTVNGNIASTTVSHFSTYVLLDLTQVFRIIEEDIVSPQEVEDTIVNIAFVVDYSSSMNDNVPEYMRLKIVKKYLTKLRENQDSTLLVQFAGYATTLVPLTSDKEMLINATDSISNTGFDSCSYDDASTNGSDGLRHALDELSTVENATYQYIIFLTDGEDTTSSYNYDDLIIEAISKNIIIYTVGMGDCDEELLSNIATSTDGKFHYACGLCCLTYEDGSSSIGKMYKAPQIKGSDEESGETYYFLNYTSIADGGIDEAICENWVIVDYVNKLSTIDFFSATTFKCQDNIVISYRGTSEIGEWIDNIVCYRLCNYHTEEIHARNYARKIAMAYPNCNIYITGHSLGGYLTQIGAAELLENTNVIPKKVVYFNGIGMNFIDHSGVIHLLKTDEMEVISDVNKFFHLIDMAYLTDYASSGSLISYEISGDVVSALGTDCGQKITFEAAMASRKNHAGKYGESDFSAWLGKVLTEFLSDITAKNISSYYSHYNTKSIMEYFWITHETDSFFYNLDQGTRSVVK